MNEHIKDYCKEFILSKKNPHFAVFINGEWGVGKTYLVNKILDELYEDCRKNKKKISCIDKSKVLKISLFGVKSGEDIDLKIYEGLHPFLSSSKAKLACAVIKASVKFGGAIDLGDDRKLNLDFSADVGSGKGTKNSGAKIKKNLLIVDDFERAELSPQLIFSYFSEIVVESDIKVIFIGNEEKILDKSDNQRNEYKQIKEKIIGMEFKVEANQDEALNCFLSELDMDQELYKERTVEIAKRLGCKNLRILRQGFYNVSLLMAMLQEELEEKDKEAILENFLVLFIQKNMGILPDNDKNIPQILSAYYDYGKTYQAYLATKEQNEDPVLESFRLRKRHYTLLKLWEKIIFEGYYNKDWILKIYREEKQLLSEQLKDQPSLFQLLGSWRSLDSRGFQQLINKVFVEFNSGKYLHPGEILLFAYHLFLFSQWGLIPENQDSVDKMINDCIKKYDDQIQVVDDWSLLLNMGGYKGYGFAKDKPKMQSLINALKKINDKNLFEHLKTEIRHDLESLDDESVNEFCKNIYHVNGNYKYYQQPILSYLDMNEFYGRLKLLSLASQQRIINAFEERYGITYSNGSLEPEYKADFINLKQLAELYKKELPEIRYNPQALIYNSIIKQIEKLIQYFESQMKNSGDSD